MRQKRNCKMPMNIQFFAEPGAGNEPGASTEPGAGQTGGAGTQPPAIDYGKIQQMLDGTLAAKEDTALKAYFKQQGLSQQEVEQAIAAFKQQKAENQPDVGAMQTQIAQAQAAAKQAAIENAAILEAVSLGIDSKTIPYLIKMADMSQVTGENGEVNQESLKNALNKVLEDIPSLKPTAAQTNGFVQVGTHGGSAQGQNTDDQIAAAFGNTKNE